MSAQNVIVLKCPNYAEFLQRFFEDSLHEVHIYEEYQELEEKPEVDFTFVEFLEDSEQPAGKVILLCAPENYQESFQNYVEAVVWPKMLEHEVGQTLLRRLLGENSSLGIESVFSRSEVNFKSFRFMDHLSMGHYSDILAQAANRNGHLPLNIRTYFDTLASFLGTLETKVDLPYDVDFGVWNDVFVIQLHASCNEITRNDFISSMSEYTLIHPERGLLKQAISQVDVLDIFTLERSERVVLTAQWFHPQFKGESPGFPSVLIHEVSNFEVLKPSFGQNTLMVPEKLPEQTESGPQEANHEEVEKVKSRLDVSEEDTLVEGAPEDLTEATSRVSGGEQDETGATSRVSGGEQDETEATTRVSGGEKDETQGTSRISGGEKDETQATSRISGGEKDETQAISRIQGDGPGGPEHKHTVKGESLNERAENSWNDKRGEGKSEKKGDQEKFVVEDLLSKSGTDEKQNTRSFDDQLKNQEVIKRDAQIDKMRKLIARMKEEIVEKNNLLSQKSDIPSLDVNASTIEKTQQRQIESQQKELDRYKRSEDIKGESHKSQIEAKDKKIEQLIEANEVLKEEKRKAEQENNSEELKALKDENGKLENQLEVSRKRISQLSEKISNGGLGDKEKAEMDRLKELGGLAQKKISEMQKELTQAEKNLSQKESENLELAERLKKIESVEASNGLDGEETLKAKYKESQQKEKELALNMKKLEQKNRFLQAQLDSAQKKNGGTQKNGAAGAGSLDRKVKQYERVIEVMKENEARAQEEIVEKRGKLQKLKSEGTSLKNKIAELEKKLQKHEKSAA